MNFNTFDLNLVRVFLALWEQRSVTAAAQRLNLTQPAISHALKRLREQFSDPLFTRVGKRMEPTEMAARLHGPFTQSLALLRETMSSYATFDPARSQRRFTIAMSDISETYLLPRILGRLTREASGVTLRSVQFAAEEIEVKLRSGQIDMALGYAPTLAGAEFDRTFLMQDRFVCILRQGHPMAGQMLTRADLERLDVIEVAPHATGFQMMRAVLQQLGVRLQIRARIEHFSAIPAIVCASDLMAIYPASATEGLVAAGTVVALELPFAAPSIDIHAHCHASFRSDPGLAWLTGLVRAALT